jgi:hypothetical protein
MVFERTVEQERHGKGDECADSNQEILKQVQDDKQLPYYWAITIVG